MIQQSASNTIKKMQAGAFSVALSLGMITSQPNMALAAPPPPPDIPYGQLAYHVVKVGV